MEVILLILIVFLSVASWLVDRLFFEFKRERRRDFYRNEYLKSDAWKRKRFVVLRRDNWKCVYCADPATEVHHKRYARKNIGREPIAWLVSVCKGCHDKLHPSSSRHRGTGPKMAQISKGKWFDTHGWGRLSKRR